MCLGQGDRIMRLAKVKSIPSHFAKVLMDGTDKTVDTALWLTWRMTRDDDFCLRLFRNLDMVGDGFFLFCALFSYSISTVFWQMKAVISWATLDEQIVPGLREENALAILANLSVQEEVMTS